MVWPTQKQETEERSGLVHCMVHVPGWALGIFGSEVGSRVLG